MWFIIFAFVAIIIFIIISGVNVDRANQEAGTFTVHQTKDSDAKWLSAKISLLEDRIFIDGAYSWQKEHIPYSNIRTAALTQGEIQMRRSKKINVYYQCTLYYKDGNGWDQTFCCTSFSPLDNHKFKIIVQRINDEIKRAEKALNSKQLNVDDNLKVNNDSCLSEHIPLNSNSEVTDDSQGSTLSTEEGIAKSTINLMSYYNEVLKNENTVDCIIDKYLEATPMELYYSEARMNCLSTCITNNTKAWLSNKILEKRIRNRIMETKTDMVHSQDELKVLDCRLNSQMVKSINTKKIDTNNSIVQSSELLINNDVNISLMKYEGCNDVSIFARCKCGLFKRFDKKNVIINYNIIKIISPYKCKKCGQTYYSFQTYGDDQMYYYFKLVKVIDYIKQKKVLQNNPINKDENHAKAYRRLISFYNESFENKQTINDIIQAYLEDTPQELYYEEKRLRCISLYLFKTTKTYNRLSNHEIIKIIEGEKFNNQQKQSSTKVDYSIVEECLQKPKNEQVDDLETDVSNEPPRGRDRGVSNLSHAAEMRGIPHPVAIKSLNENIHEFNNLDQLNGFVEADIVHNPQKYIDMEELAEVLIDEKTRCFCPQCRSEQTVIIMKNSTVKCLCCNKVYDADFKFDVEDNEAVDDIKNQPQSAYLNEDYYYANRACEDEMNNVEIGSAVEITLDEENCNSSNISIPIPERVTNEELGEETERNSNSEHKRNYVVKNNKLTSKWSSVPEITFELATDRSFESSEEQFYKQAKRWEKRTENEHVEVEFMQYRPIYSGMTDGQLKWYFTWRKNIREGIYNNTSLSYIYLYIYELINQIGVENTEDGLKRIIEIWKQLRMFHKHLDRYLTKWIRDYIVYYGCEENYFDIVLEVMKDEGYEFICDEYLIRIFENKETSNLLQVMNMCCGYKILKSKFIGAGYGEVMEKCFADVLIAINNSFIETTGKPLIEEFINMNQVYNWNPFASAVFYKGNKSCIVERRFINKYISYWRENSNFHTSYSDYNAWYRVPKLKGFIADSLKCAETHLRFLLEFKGKLKYDSLPIDIQLLVQKVVQANYFKYHSTGKMYDESNSRLVVQKSSDYQIEAKKQEFVIDVSKLDVLRKESDEIRDKLIAEQSLEDEVGMNKSPIECFTVNNATEIKDETLSNEWLKFVCSLDIHQKEALSVILCKKNVNEQLLSIAQKKLVMREMLIESINEAAFEYIGDNLIDTNDSIPFVYDDYIDNILTVINTEV